MMESPGVFPESPMDQEDAAYPCKGCGEILEEGKAFELAGNRWHIDCFRCNTCNTLLDSDANLLLLGDGSLICNNCTYSCNACGNKIEDLAILTGDQAFCASCFRCRNCKRKIENLRYARTSQGIFCMSCHESLMARRRKKTRANREQQQKTGSNSQSPMLLDKSLPSLPSSLPGQSATNAPPIPTSATSSLAPDHSTPPSESLTETPTDNSPRPKPSSQRNELASSRGAMQERSQPPLETGHADDASARKENAKANILLPSTTYESSRTPPPPEFQARTSGDSNDPFSSFIPLALDDRPATGPSPLVQSQTFGENSHEKEAAPSKPKESKGDRDYFNVTRTPSGRKETLDKTNKKVGSPHVAYQEKGRQPSSELTDMIRNRSRSEFGGDGQNAANLRSTSSGDNTKVQHVPAPLQNGRTASGSGDKFKLQEVPKSRKSGSTRSSKSGVPSPSPDGSKEQIAIPQTDSPKPVVGLGVMDGSPRISQDSRNDSVNSMASSQMQHNPRREDSLAAAIPKQTIARKELPSSGSSSSSPHAPGFGPPQGSGTSTEVSTSALAATNGNKMTPPSSGDSEGKQIPPKSKGRPPVGAAGQYGVSRGPMVGEEQHMPTSAGTTRTDSSRGGDAPLSSPALPQYLAGGDFNMEEDMARILGGQDESSTSLLRRVSNAVRHGRSFSDMAARTSSSPKYAKSPPNGSIAREITTPTSSPETKEENVVLKHELRRSAQKIAELERRINGTHEIKSLDTKLREKRSTVAFLDSQKEIVVRELEVLTDHVAQAKHNDKPINLDDLSNSVIREFAESLERLKDSYAPEIEELVHQRNQLLEENANLTRLRDQAIQETEQLNLKNAQLADLNNELTQQIQERYKANRAFPVDHTMDSPRANGLGIYTHHHKEPSIASMDTRDMRPMTAAGASSSYSTLVPTPQEQSEGEPATVLTAPHVINIRKGQAKKFNWKKGGQSVAKGVSKGFKGAFSSTDRQNQPYLQQDRPMAEGLPYGMTQAGETPTTIKPSDMQNKQPRFGIFAAASRGQPGRSASNGNINALISEPGLGNPSILFGSDLGERAEFERRQIPSVVTRCIEEVELRGMDIEGIYRKTGGNSLVKVIQEGFEKSEDFDISDPGLDITAVTSVLKQYFRKLPNPLLTFDSYDRVLEVNGLHELHLKIDSFRATINSLPPRHRDCLEFLIFHLARVATREKENLMTPKNLAVVFAPTIMRDTSLEREMTDMHSKNQAVQFLIENNKSIFAT